MLKQPTCHYFNSTGKCRFGKRCRFSHDLHITKTDLNLDPNIQDGAVNSESVNQSVGLPRYFYSENNKNDEGLNPDNIPADSVSRTSTCKRELQHNKDDSLNTEQGDQSAQTLTRNKPICKNYARERFCRLGNRCGYRHVIAGARSERQTDDLNDFGYEGRNEKKVQDEEQTVQGERLEDNSERQVSAKEEKKKQSRRICFFYKQGYCRKGRNCFFQHPGWSKPVKNDNGAKSMKTESKSSITKERTVTLDTEKTSLCEVPQITHCYKKDEVSDENLSEMRASEIRQLKQRFTSEKLKCLEDTETNAKFVFTYSPSDPDLPIEVKIFEIAVEFAHDYPMKMFKLSLPVEQDLPETVRRYIEVSLEEWIKMKEEQAVARRTVEQLFSPFLMWLDRNIEQLVNQALKKFRRELPVQAEEFISAKKLGKIHNQSSIKDEIVNNDEEQTEQKHPGGTKPVKNENGVGSLKTNSTSSVTEKSTTSIGTAKTSFRKAPQITHCYRRDEVTLEHLSEMRASEIRQLKRRFTSDRLKCLKETETNAKFVFTFSPTDPDWPFEVKIFEIAVEFTQEYPMKMFKLSLPVEQDLPETVRRYIEVSLEEWVLMKEEQAVTRGTVEQLFRPFLRWLDRNMEEMVTQALKQFRRELTAQAAGLEFISAKDLRKEFNRSLVIDESANDDAVPEEKTEPEVIVYKKSDQIIEEVYEVPKRERTPSNSDDDNNTNSDEEVDETEHRRPQINPDTERRGTELSFRNMQIWFCTTVMMEKLMLTIQCERCKHTEEFATPPTRVNSITCGKCHAVQLVVFRATLAHSYCSTFGYLDLDGCIAFDVNMQECHFSMGCIQCNRDVLVKHCTPGKMLEPFCRLCHNKMQFATESVKMTKLTTDVERNYFSGNVHQVQSKKVRQAGKNPAIQDGKPLPNNGSCKHYKKSFRWLRFPCCGKTYPCDECHDDNEDHEMKFANRIICGFCCREQPYAAEKPCLGCSSALTKMRTTHWEGGKGCRDKISMSRNDNQKYANLHKTESKKSQALKEKNKGKKNTKLRHT